MHRTKNLAIAAIAAIAVAGCAAPVFDGKYNYEEGWREGVVTEVGRSDEITAHPGLDCRKDVSPGVARETRFARVRFSSGRRTVSQVASLPDDADLHPGDGVLVKMDDCSATLEPTTSR